jgi:hypothetical protein
MLEPSGAVAVMVAEPGPTAVTGTGTLEAPPEIVTLEGTVTAPALLDERAIVKPLEGATVDRFNCRLLLPAPARFKLFGEKLNAPPLDCAGWT